MLEIHALPEKQWKSYLWNTHTSYPEPFSEHKHNSQHRDMIFLVESSRRSAANTLRLGKTDTRKIQSV